MYREWQPEVVRACTARPPLARWTLPQPPQDVFVEVLPQSPAAQGRGRPLIGLASSSGNTPVQTASAPLTRENRAGQAALQHAS
jgi:hypothetical protein